MRSFIPIIEQLDRAVAELREDHPLNGRIALILVDNALELLCHRKCTDIREKDRHERRLSLTQRTAAAGRNFDQKIKFLKNEGHVQADHERAIRILHEYRNQLYHVGLCDDPIIGQLAQLYFQLTASLLVCLFGNQRHLGWEPDFASAVVLRVLPELASAKSNRCKVDFAGLRTRLLANCPRATMTLPKALGDHLVTSVNRVEEDFNFIARGRSGHEEPLATLRSVQLEGDTLAAIAKHNHDQGKVLKVLGLRPKLFDLERLSIARGTKHFVDLNARFLPDWTPRHPRLPFSSWRKRAHAIGSEVQDLPALDKFDRVRKEIEYFEDIMIVPIEDMHGWHQYLEDVAMDSR